MANHQTISTVNAKYLFVTGGVVSSLGKGIISSSLACLLQARGYRVAIQKFDPYINIDSGTLNPYEHGECYVTADGHEGDLDLGHYERFTDIRTTRANNITAGRIYQSVIHKERQGAYLGKTVQIVPHVTDEIKQMIIALGQSGDYDFVIIEIGGVVGDIESLPFLEAVRQLRWELGNDALCLHLTYLPYLSAAGELKTKPTQHSVKTLQSLGIQPDILILRTEKQVSEELRRKIALFGNVQPEAVIQSIDLPSIYRVPVAMHEQGLDEIVLSKTHSPMPWGQLEMTPWVDFLERMEAAGESVSIGLVGKYVELQDAYKSISESLLHAATYKDRRLDLRYIHSESINDANADQLLKDLDAVVVAPGFGTRGIEGKLSALQWCREHDVPTLGICLGMQCMVIEFARNVLQMADADSTEMNAYSSQPVISLMEEQKSVTAKGGTMRLGAYRCELNPASRVATAYGCTSIEERHRHRYEFNSRYRQAFEQAGMKCAGINPDTGLVEVVEIPRNRWYIGTQYHPEYTSTVLKPNPLFLSLVDTAINFGREKQATSESDIDSAPRP